MGVKINENRNIITNDDDSTSVSGIYAIGDVCRENI